MASSYEAFGFSENAMVAKIMLAQVEASLGNSAGATTTLKELDGVEHGDPVLQSKIDLAKGNVAYRQGKVGARQRIGENWNTFLQAMITLNYRDRPKRF